MILARAFDAVFVGALLLLPILGLIALFLAGRELVHLLTGR